MISARHLAHLSAVAIVAVLVVACQGQQSIAGSETPGGRLYAINCSTCHGPAGKGVGDLPTIVGTSAILDGDYARTVIAEGRNVMPAFGGKLSQAEINQIVDYVATFKR
jgi:mono/diheme cytochrome c family protein